jgi:non-heme chloroperoxidase
MVDPASLGMAMTWTPMPMTSTSYSNIEHLDLKDVMMVGHSTGGGEVARFVGRYGTSRVSKAVLVSAVPPLVVMTDQNPGGLPIEVIDGFRAAMVKDRARFFYDVPNGPCFGFNRENAKVSQGLIQSWWDQEMMCGFKGAYDCIKAFLEADLTEDLKKMDIPVLLLHGDDDQAVPIGASAQNASKSVPKGTFKTYLGAPHALPNTHVDDVNQELLAFLNTKMREEYSS